VCFEFKNEQLSRRIKDVHQIKIVFKRMKRRMATSVNFH
jgi:hypothetical protein